MSKNLKLISKIKFDLKIFFELIQSKRIRFKCQKQIEVEPFSGNQNNTWNKWYVALVKNSSAQIKPKTRIRLSSYVNVLYKIYQPNLTKLIFCAKNSLLSSQNNN